MKKYVFALLFATSAASFNANAGTLQEEFASLLSYLGVDVEARTSRPRPPKEW